MELAFQAQLDEYRRLFQQEPAHFNGHMHKHLCMNMIVGGVIPVGSAVRRSFTFRRGEKGIFNRFYRRVVNSWLVKRYLSTDAFFSLEPSGDLARLRKIMDLALSSKVELMVHPWKADEFALLMSDEFRDLIGPLELGVFSCLAISA